MIIICDKKGVEEEEYIFPCLTEKESCGKLQCCEILRTGVWKVALELE